MCAWSKILTLSNGATVVLAQQPAIPILKKKKKEDIIGTLIYSNLNNETWNSSDKNGKTCRCKDVVLNLLRQ